MTYCLEKRAIQQTEKSSETIWKRYASCGSPKLLERVRLGQECPEHWRVVLESAPLEKERIAMIDAEIARPLELELQELFGEDSYQLECRPCTGKYRGHRDYTLVFGSGRRLYVGLDQRNYLNGLHDHLRDIQHFRAHQEENSQRISAALAAQDTPFCRAEAEIMPYDGTLSLTLYAVVVLYTSCGVRFVYRTTNMHGYLVGYNAPCFAFDSCMAHLLRDVGGKMTHTNLLADRDAA